MKRITFYVIAVFVVAAVTFLGGIRGYENWAFHEIALVYFLLGCALTQSYHRYVSTPKPVRANR